MLNLRVKQKESAHQFEVNSSSLVEVVGGTGQRTLNLSDQTLLLFIINMWRVQHHAEIEFHWYARGRRDVTALLHL